MKITALRTREVVRAGWLLLLAGLALAAPTRPLTPGVIEFPLKQWPLTVRQVLSHQGGIRHYRDYNENRNLSHYSTLAESLRLFRNDPLLFEPGTQFFYSSHGYTLLGCIVESASRMRFGCAAAGTDPGHNL